MQRYESHPQKTESTWQQGASAARRGEDWRSCPYRSGDPLDRDRAAWINGWEFARQQQQKEKPKADIHEDAARRIAYIMGEESAAARALKELAARRARGEPAAIRRQDRSWVVGVFPDQVPCASEGD